MKTYRIALVDKFIDIEMPSWIFFFFKRFCKLKMKRHNFELDGQSLNAIFLDEIDFK